MDTARGVTMIELLITIGVIGVLASVIYAAINVPVQFAKARDAQRKNDLSNMQTALELFYNDNNRYPTNAEGFAVLAPLYIQAVPPDPQSPTRAYRYEQELTGQGFEAYAALERCNPPTTPLCSDTQACSNGTGDCSARAAGNCGSLACRYGIASSNLSKP